MKSSLNVKGVFDLQFERYESESLSGIDLKVSHMVSQLRSQTAGRRVTRSQSAGPKPERKGKSRKTTNQTPRYAGISFASE